MWKEEVTYEVGLSFLCSNQMHTALTPNALDLWQTRQMEALNKQRLYKK